MSLTVSESPERMLPARLSPSSPMRSSRSRWLPTIASPRSARNASRPSARLISISSTAAPASRRSRAAVRQMRSISSSTPIPAISGAYARRTPLRFLAFASRSRALFHGAGLESGDFPESPVIASSSSAQSSAERAIGPATLWSCQGSVAGCLGTRPAVVRRPTTPQKAAGVRKLPPKSVPSASGAMRAASAAAPPPVEPEAESAVFHGLRVAPNTLFTVLAPAPNSGVLVLPSTIAPATFSRRTISASSVGTWSRNSVEPQVVRIPAVGVRSLIATGTPCRAPSLARFFTAASASRAQTSAFSAATVQKALTAGLSFSIAARCASVTSNGLAFLVRMSRASSTAERWVSSSVFIFPRGIFMRCNLPARIIYFPAAAQQAARCHGSGADRSGEANGNEPAQSIRTARAKALPPFFPHPVPRRLQRQRLQERLDHTGRVPRGGHEQVRRQHPFECGPGGFHPAVLPFFRHRGAARRQARKIVSDAPGEARRDRHHGARRGGPLPQRPAAPDDRAVPDGTALDGVRAGEIRVPAAAPESGGDRRRERAGRNGHLCRDPGRHPARRVSHRRRRAGPRIGDHPGAGSRRLRGEPLDPGLSAGGAGACDQLEPLLRDLENPAVHAPQPHRVSFGAGNFLVLVPRRGLPVAVPRLRAG